MVVLGVNLSLCQRCVRLMHHRSTSSQLAPQNSILLLQPRQLEEQLRILLLQDTHLLQHGINAILQRSSRLPASTTPTTASELRQLRWGMNSGWQCWEIKSAVGVGGRCGHYWGTGASTLRALTTA